MKKNIVKFMIEQDYVQKNSVIKATIKSYGLGGMPVELDKDLLFEDHAQSPKGGLYIKGCDPENLREYVVGASNIHQINGMDQKTIERLFPEIAG